MLTAMMRIPGLIIVTLLWLGSSPLALPGQGSRSVVPCGKDSAFAELYRTYLQAGDSAQGSSARFQWVRPTPERCSSARWAMMPDTATSQTDAVLYVYTVT